MKFFKLKWISLFMVLVMGIFSSSTIFAAKQHLTIGVPQDPQNWDPMDTFRMAWSAIATSVFEGLVERDLDMEIKPALAESWEAVTAEKRIRFHLRKGVKFHSGHDFKADSVKYTFDRLLAKDSKSPQKGNYSAITEVKIIDDYTVDFMLKEIDPVLIVKLSGYGGVIVPKAYIEEKGEDHFDSYPVGTGPFKVVQYVRDQKVELERFNGYWKKPIAKLEKVTFRIIPEPSTRLAELQTGNIDIMTHVPVSQSDTIAADKNLELVKVDSPTVYSLRFNTDQKPTDNVKVREAIGLAIDIDTIIETVLKGYARRINSFQSKLSFGYDPSLPIRTYNPKRAKQLLKEAGYDFNQTLIMRSTASDTTFKEIAQAAQLYLKQVGIKTKFETVETNVFYSDMIPHGKAGQIYRFGWGGWTLDFDNTAYLLYHKGEHWNPDFYDEEVERLLSMERSTMDQKIRKDAFNKLNKRLYELVPEIPLYQRVDVLGVSKRVKNYRAPVDGRQRLEAVYMAK